MDEVFSLDYDVFLLELYSGTCRVHERRAHAMQDTLRWEQWYGTTGNQTVLALSLKSSAPLLGSRIEHRYFLIESGHIPVPANLRQFG